MITDTIGTSYTKITAMTGNSLNLAVYAGIAPSSGANTVTVSGGSGSLDRIAIAEFRNLTTAVDVQTSVYTSSTPTSQSLTTTTTNDMVVLCVGGFHSGNTFSWTGMTQASQSNGADANGMAYGVAASAGTFSETTTITDPGGHVDNSPQILIAFKAIASPVTGSDGSLYFQTSSIPYPFWVYKSSVWHKVAN